MSKLLTREEFREGVFERDKRLCVICQSPAQDSHHIMERRLWNDGGYYLDNGASLCGEHHVLAEQTVLSCAEIREKAKITKVILPEHLYDEYEYTKWGDLINPSGMRTRGELFYDESVQKILARGGVMHLYDFKIKHPRTFHLPWSESLTDDDRMLRDLESFAGREIVISEKLDGEQATMYSNGYCHARSLDSSNDCTRSWVKNLCSQIFFNIPKDWRVCGENMAYKHSILYSGLETFFFVHSIWDDKNVCLSWDDTVTYAELLGLKVVPVLFRGKFEDFKHEGFFRPVIDGRESEGYVMRLADSFNFSQFKKCVAKYVRKDHLQTIEHWRHGKQLQQNSLKTTV